MKQRRVIFLRKQKGTIIMGVTQNADATWIADGQIVSPDRGGGKIASMIMRDGMIEIRKVDNDGKPIRDFGRIPMGAPGQIKQLVADGVAFPAHLCTGILFLDEEIPDATTAQDPPVAKPVQSQQQQRR